MTNRVMCISESFSTQTGEGRLAAYGKHRMRSKMEVVDKPGTIGVNAISPP